MSKVMVADQALGNIVHREKAADGPSGLVDSTVRGTLLGFLAGAANGGVLLSYVPKTAENWTQGAIIVLVCSLGWALYGAITGGSGILARGGKTEA